MSVSLQPLATPPPDEGETALDIRMRQRGRAVAAAFAALTLCFGFALAAWARFVATSDLYSHALLIPVVSAFFLWKQRRSLLGDGSRPPWLTAAAVLGLALSFCALVVFHRSTAVLQDRIAIATCGYVLGTIALALFFFGARVRHTAFPLLFLFAMAPFTTGQEAWVESALQHASAEAAYRLFVVAGASLFRDGMLFHLPGISLLVAPQCSGIHSSLVLFVTSLVAGYVFLRCPTHRVLLALAVIPLGIMRNGLRVFVLGQLCVHVDRNLIHSDLHHRGGPIFFALSLIPFVALLWVLMRLEARRRKAAAELTVASTTPRPEAAG